MRERLKVETEKAIVEAAEQAFATEGLATARMETVAARAGVAVGTLYNYFEDRADLVRALAKHRREELVRSLDEALASAADAPFEAELEAFVRGVLGFVDAHLDFFHLMMAAEWTQHPAERADGFHKTMVELVARADRVLAKGVRERAVPSARPGFLAAALVGIVRSMVIGKVKGYLSGPVVDVTPDVVHLFLHGAVSPRERRR